MATNLIFCGGQKEQEWQRVHGATLSYADDGWRLQWTLVPASPTKTSGELKLKQVFKSTQS